MDISTTTFLLSLFVAFVIGCLIGYCLHFGLKNIKNRLKVLGLSFRYKLVDYWFGLILTAATIFVFVHFKECVALSFTADFNGMNLIFLFWLALLLFPMFESFEGFGISIKKRKYDKEKEAITSDFHAQILNAQIKKEQERKEAEHE
jgi:hypothetical protein